MNNIILINGEEENENKTEVCSKQGGIYEEFRKLDAEKNVKRPRKQKNPKRSRKKRTDKGRGARIKRVKGQGGWGRKKKLNINCQKVVKKLSSSLKPKTRLQLFQERLTS